MNDYINLVMISGLIPTHYGKECLAVFDVILCVISEVWFTQAIEEYTDE